MTHEMKAYLERTLIRARNVRAHLADLSEKVRRQPVFLEFQDTPAAIAREADAIRDLGNDQASIVSGIEELLYK